MEAPFSGALNFTLELIPLRLVKLIKPDALFFHVVILLD